MGADPDKPARRPRLLKPVRKAVRRWRRKIRIHLGIGLSMADRGYMICTSARSGSNYLSQLLASTGVLGRPDEYFNHLRRKVIAPGWPDDPRCQLHLVRSMGATSNGIYAVKVFPVHLRMGRVDPFRALPSLTLVALHRRDRLGQAISLARGRQTSQYVSYFPTNGVARYDAQAIRTALAFLESQDAAWAETRLRLGVEPPVLEYEALQADPQHAVDRIASLLGIPLPVPINPAEVRVTVQRDDLNVEWRRRFLEETGDEFRHLAVGAMPRSTPGSASAS